MVVPEEILKCVAFVGARKADGGFVYCGSVFFLGRDLGDNSCRPVFAVTARHVIDKIRSLGCTQIWLRLNLSKGGAEWFSSEISAWYTHPTDASIDVALIEWGIPAEIDHRVLPHGMVVSEELVRENEIGLGEEVLITGLFSLFRGADRNIPIVRVGNLSCLAPERIPTESYGKIHGILIEARSTGGLSGSPVFVNLGRSRVVRGELRIEKERPVIYLLGLVHGHFQAKPLNEENAAPAHSDEVTPEKLNVGIAVVVPVNSIFEVIVAYMKSTEQAW